MNMMTTLPGAGPQTMSSLEIAELTKKRHADVMRDIRTMLEQPGLTERSFASSYRDSTGRELPCYNLPRNLTVTLVTGYSIPMRHAVVTRLEELEAQQAPRLPTHAEALRLYADSLDQLALAMNMMTAITTLAVREIEGEGRVLDTDLGAALEMAQPLNIRTTIKAHWDALEAFGPIYAVREMVTIGSGAQRAVTAYWLNEEQATYVTMHLRTPKAQAVTASLSRAPFRASSSLVAQPHQQAIGHKGSAGVLASTEFFVRCLEYRENECCAEALPASHYEL